MITIFILYVCGLISFILWDACIGFGVDFDGTYNPPLFLVALFWFITVPCLLVYGFTKLCSYLKNARLKREADRKARIKNKD